MAEKNKVSAAFAPVLYGIQQNYKAFIHPYTVLLSSTETERPAFKSAETERHSLRHDSLFLMCDSPLSCQHSAAQSDPSGSTGRFRTGSIGYKEGTSAKIHRKTHRGS